MAPSTAARQPSCFPSGLKLKETISPTNRGSNRWEAFLFDKSQSWTVSGDLGSGPGKEAAKNLPSALKATSGMESGASLHVRTSERLAKSSSRRLRLEDSATTMN